MDPYPEVDDDNYINVTVKTGKSTRRKKKKTNSYEEAPPLPRPKGQKKSRGAHNDARDDADRDSPPEEGGMYGRTLPDATQTTTRKKSRNDGNKIRSRACAEDAVSPAAPQKYRPPSHQFEDDFEEDPIHEVEFHGVTNEGYLDEKKQVKATDTSHTGRFGVFTGSLWDVSLPQLTSFHTVRRKSIHTQLRHRIYV